MMMDSFSQKKEHIPFLQKISRNVHPAHTLALSFLMIIILGTILLSLPWSCAEGTLSFLDALFTATSATCVTGLIVVQTGEKFTQFGQIVILSLIQIGGLGIMTFSTLFAYLIAGRLSIRGHVIAEESIGRGPLPHVGRLLLFIVLGTFVVEAIGGLILSLRFSADYPPGYAFFLGFFHSISAFCNAGFSLFPNSLVDYRNDPIVNLTIMMLIIIGGLGFWVLFDLKNIRGPRGLRALTMHSKIVLTMTAILIGTGFVGIMLLEWNNTLADLSLSGKILSAAFQSVTSRTAGFNTIPIENLTNSTLLLLIIFMMIGASPGSCGGGIKTTTFGVLMAMIFSRLRDQQQVRLFNRGVPETIISKSIGIAFFWLVAVTSVSMLLLVSEHPGGPHELGRTLFIETIFEAFSAMGTVGLSMGLTPFLTGIGKVMIILLMYIGRIGPVTIALAIAVGKPLRIRLAEEKFMVG